ncbi:MAG: sensor histidine kinase [Anaerolineae bacterium]|nr:MAG: sensor histidine kinase [Anaerolineae bacterium]
MAQEMTTRRENIGFLVTSYVILVAAGVVGLKFNPPATVTLRWVAVILLAAIALVQTRMPKAGSPSWKFHLYLGVHGSLVAALLFLQPGWTMYPVLYFASCVWAILALSVHPGVYWIVAYTVVTAASFAVGISPGEGLVALFLYGVLYAFAAAFASALARADAARRESQSLLAELQKAHRQLQEYALRAEELAVVEERNRLAREMHDTLGHRLTVASVQLEAAQRLCPTDSERAASLVGTVRQQVREALSELRSTVAALRTPVEADLQLRSSLRRLMEHFEEATGLTVNRILPEEMPHLPDSHRLALYRAAQEALTNIQKHAEAGQVWLVLSTSDEAVTLLVGDDGRGLTLSRDATGFGLRGLRERAEQLGGELHVEPRRGSGTQLSFRLPLPTEESSG